MNTLPHLIRMTSKLFRYSQGHMDMVLKKYGLSSGIYPYLFVLEHEEGINLDRVSRILEVDKAMSTRAIRKLVEMGYLRKEADDVDARAFKLYLTQKARKVIPDLHAEADLWIDEITQDLSEMEKDTVGALILKICKRAEEGRRNEENGK